MLVESAGRRDSDSLTPVLVVDISRVGTLRLTIENLRLRVSCLDLARFDRRPAIGDRDAQRRSQGSWSRLPCGRPCATAAVAGYLYVAGGRVRAGTFVCESHGRSYV